MTDKVQKIREEIERLKEWQPIASPSLNKLLSLLDSMQEEPASEDLEKAYKKIIEKGGVSFLKIFKAGAEWYASHNTKLPDNLLLAARKASIDMCDIDDKHLDEYPYHPIAEQKFIEGANWQKSRTIEWLWNKGIEPPNNKHPYPVINPDTQEMAFAYYHNGWQFDRDYNPGHNMLWLDIEKILPKTQEEE